MNYQRYQSDNVEIIDFIAGPFQSKQQKPPDQIITNEDGLTPLLLAVYHGKLTSAQHLITKYNSNPLLIDRVKPNILHLSACQNDAKVVDYVMSIQGVPESINERNQNGFTPILLGAFHGNFDVVKHLIDVYGADASITDRLNGGSLLQAAAAHSNIDMVDYVLSKNPSLLEVCDHSQRTPILDAANYGSLNVVKHLIEKYKANVAHIAQRGVNILHFACRNDSVELVDYIISLDPFRVESTNESGYTPLFYAVLANKPQIFQQHLVDKYNANAHHVTNSRRNLMHYAIQTANPELIRLVSKSFETVPMDFNPLEKHRTKRYYDHIVGNWRSGYDILRKALSRRKLQSMRELIRLKANLFFVGPQNLGTLLYHATKLKNADGTRDSRFVEYLLSDELKEDWCQKTNLVKSHGLDADELKLYNNPDPITMLLDCKVDAYRDGAKRFLLLKAGYDRD